MSEQAQAQGMPKLLLNKPAHATFIATNIDIEQAINKHFKNIGLANAGYYGCKVVNESRLDLFFTEKLKYVHGKAGNVNSALIKKLDLVNTLDVDFEGLFEVLGGTFVGDMYELQNGYEEINDGSNMSGFIINSNLPLALRVINGMDTNNVDVIEVEKVVPWSSQKGGNSLLVKYIRYNLEEMERIQNLFGPVNNNRGKGSYNAFRSANNQ